MSAKDGPTEPVPDDGGRRAARLSFLLATVAVSLVSLVTGCSGPQRVLAPAGPGSQMLADLFWWLLGWTLLPAIAVILLVLVAVRRGKRSASNATPRAPVDPKRVFPRETAVMLVAGGLVPTAILLVLLVLSARAAGAALMIHRSPDLVVDVVGHQYWWEVRYPEHGVTTANEIHVPAGATVLFRVSSADVIHSFWVPELQGKLDMVPGKVLEYRVVADVPGIHRGQCAEFCGLQHARMAMLLVADRPADFDAWVRAMRSPRPAPKNDLEWKAESIFARNACNRCHTVRDRFVLEEVGQPGPDLTHVGSRRTLAAGTLVSSRDELRDFIRDPHRSKPGVRMPPAPALTDAELDALVTWLSWDGDRTR